MRGIAFFFVTKKKYDRNNGVKVNKKYTKFNALKILNELIHFFQC
jgi:hypothetical protein